MLWDMQDSLPEMVDEAVKRIEEKAKRDVADAGVKVIEEAVKEMPAFVKEHTTKLVKDIQKGLDGTTPKRGTDYWTRDDKKEIVRVVMGLIKIPQPIPGKPGAPGAPGKSVDKKEIAEMVENALGKALVGMEKGESLTKQSVEEIAKDLQKSIDFTQYAEKIARALETLKGVSQLDYYALKNRPGVKMYEQDGTTKRTMMRGGSGGGKESLNYDLSDLCDGVTKTFPIPSNKRVLGVWGTQAPAGGYVPVTDFTRTSTTVTLTATVMAPEAGQTLWLIYVPL
jgi:hypothetical protein